MPYEPGRERPEVRNNREGAMHEVSDNPHQHISESEIKSTNVPKDGHPVIAPDAGFMNVHPKGSPFPKSTGSKAA